MPKLTVGVDEPSQHDLESVRIWLEQRNGNQTGQVTPLTRHREAQAALAELQLGERRGELVRAADVERVWTETVITLRTKLLAVPSKLKLQEPDVPHGMLAAVDTLINAALEEIADAGAVDRASA